MTAAHRPPLTAAQAARADAVIAVLNRLRIDLGGRSVGAVSEHQAAGARRRKRWARRQAKNGKIL